MCVGRVACDSEFDCDNGDGTGPVEVVDACQALYSEVTIGRMQYVQSTAIGLFQALVLPLLLMTLALPFRIYFPLIVSMVSLCALLSLIRVSMLPRGQSIVTMLWWTCHVVSRY